MPRVIARVAFLVLLGQWLRARHSQHSDGPAGARVWVDARQYLVRHLYQHSLVWSHWPLRAVPDDALRHAPRIANGRRFARRCRGRDRADLQTLAPGRHCPP